MPKQNSKSKYEEDQDDEKEDTPRKGKPSKIQDEFEFDGDLEEEVEPVSRKNPKAKLPSNVVPGPISTIWEDIPKKALEKRMKLPLGTPEQCAEAVKAFYEKHGRLPEKSDGRIWRQFKLAQSAWIKEQRKAA